MTAGVFSSAVKNFPAERGAVTGILKAWVGFSSGIMTQLYVGLAGLAVGESSVILLHAPLPLAGFSIGMKMRCRQNDSLADG